MATRVARPARRKPLPQLTHHPKPEERRGRPWSVTILRALNPDGSVLWPGMMSLDAYRDLYQSGGAALFLATRMQDPSGLQGTVFRPEWFQWYVRPDYYDPEGASARQLLAAGRIDAILPPPESLIPGMAADFAISQKQTADSYARVAGFGDVAGNLWIDDVLVLGQRDLTPDTMIEDLIHTAQRYRVKVAGLETTAFQVLMKWLLEKQAPRVPWRDLGPQGSGKEGSNRPGRMLDKVVRARMGLQPAYERFKVFHRLDMRQREQFETTMLGFPTQPHDDAVDGAMYLWDCLSRIDPSQYRGIAQLMEDLRQDAPPDRYTDL